MTDEKMYAIENWILSKLWYFSISFCAFTWVGVIIKYNIFGIAEFFKLIGLLIAAIILKIVL